MKKIIRHYELPAPSTDTISEATFCLDGANALIRFDYFCDNCPKRSGLLFRGVISTQYCSEKYATSRQTKSFDVLREIVDSEWIKNTCGDRYGNKLPRHFVFYFDSVGGFEVLADDFEVLPEELGSWEELNNSLMPS